MTAPAALEISDPDGDQEPLVFVPVADPATQVLYRQWIELMINDFDFGLFKLKPNSKYPAVRKNLDADKILTVEEAVAWRLKGGNLGINLWVSRLVGLDNEDAMASQAATEAGFAPYIRTAHAQDPENDEKFGGGHCWLRVPGDIDAKTLPTTGMRVRLPNGGLLDVCAGRRYLVAPTSELDGRVYMQIPGTVINIPEAPRWLFQQGLGAPASYATAAGRLAPRPVREQVELDVRTQELNEKIDQIPWPQWLEGLDAVLVPTRQTDSCEGGCDVRHFLGASHDKSLTTHDRCGTNGNSGHWWSETAMLQLGADQATMSRLDVRALVTYGAINRETRKQAAGDVGLNLGGGDDDDREPLDSIFDADEMESMAAAAEAAGDERRAAAYRQTIAGMRKRSDKMREEAVARGEVFFDNAPVRGAVVPNMLGVVAPTPSTVPPARPQLQVIEGGGEAPAAASAASLTVAPPIGNIGGNSTATGAVPPIGNIGTETIPPMGQGQRPEFAAPQQEAAQPAPQPAPGPAADANDHTPEDRHAAAMERAVALLDQADAVERLDAIFCTDLLKEIRRRADSAMVSPMVALGTNLSATLLCVPWDVRLPRVVTKRRAPLNLLTIVVDESGGGKNGLTAVDVEPYPHGTYGLPDAVSGRIAVPEPKSVGSGEAISTLLAHMETETDEVPDGNGGFRKERTRIPVMHNTAAWLAWDEVTKVTTVRDRKGSTIEAEVIQFINGEPLGSNTKTNECVVERDTYRGCVSIAAQLVTAALLLQNEFVGILQRMLFLSAVFRISAEAATAEALAKGRRSADGQYFEEPDDDEVLIAVELPQWWQNARGDKLIRITADVAAIFEKHRAEHGQGRKVHPWDRHLLLIQLKVAAAGVIMHGPQEQYDVATVDMAWWNWAGLIMDHHKLVRAAVVELKELAMQVAAKIDGDKDAERLAAKEERQWRNGRASVLRFAAKKGRGVEFTAKQFGMSTSGFPKTSAGDLCLSLVESGDLVGRAGTASNGVDTNFYSLPA